MPELPEVEITRRGIAPHLLGQTVTRVVVRDRRMRWPVPRDLERTLTGSTVRGITRRGKYLLLACTNAKNPGKSGSLILHLGMSGSLRILPRGAEVKKHDHFDLEFGEKLLRLHDPRRFGAVLWERGDIAAHPLIAGLGVEPLEAQFTATFLHNAMRGRAAAIKLALMDHKMVVGVGNIYANESLFHARINPATRASRVSLARCERLVGTVRDTLEKALKAGGSSLRDFVHSDGSSGYFQQEYFVYGRDGQPCRLCGTTIRIKRMGQRSTFYCPSCQT
jgi:formamidopyrimidine-DNA glycosylase